MKMEWYIEDDGDLALYVDGDYFGIVCAHRDRQYSIVAIHDNHMWSVQSIEEGKTFLEVVAEKELV